VQQELVSDHSWDHFVADLVMTLLVIVKLEFFVNYLKRLFRSNLLQLNRVAFLIYSFRVDSVSFFSRLDIDLLLRLIDDKPLDKRRLENDIDAFVKEIELVLL
jgi:hypothetical protein